ncbi:hypothetical protein HDU96_007720 [Phlyctochytrium bullatum]|nr:hypothetical protein HDU96_007720 [Phlyctochytrium bullatum]
MTWTRTAPVVVDVTYEQSDRKASLAGFLRRMSTLAPPRSPVSNVPATASSETHTKSVSSQADENHGGQVPVAQNRRMTAVNPQDIEALSKAPTSPIKLTSNGISPHSTTLAPAGQITRFCVPLSPSDLEATTPKTAKSRRRSLSYANSVNASGSPASYEDWLALMASERVENATNQDYDSVAPFSKEAFSPKSPPIAEEDEREVEIESPKSRSEIKTYDAVLFATDNDFLESARIRSIFKHNAVQPEDAVLFEMKPFTGAEPESPVVVIVEENPACEFCYPSPATLNRSSPMMQIFHKVKCYVAALLLMLAMFFFTLRDNSNRSGGSGPVTTSKP